MLSFARRLLEVNSYRRSDKIETFPMEMSRSRTHHCGSCASGRRSRQLP